MKRPSGAARDENVVEALDVKGLRAAKMVQDDDEHGFQCVAKNYFRDLAVVSDDATALEATKIIKKFILAHLNDPDPK